MKIGILTKKTNGFAGQMKIYFQNIGHQVNLYTMQNLCINETLMQNDFYVLKSKGLFFLYAAHYLEINGVLVVPNADITYKHKNRLESHNLLEKSGLLFPAHFFGYKNVLLAHLSEDDFPLVIKPITGSGSRGVKLLNSLKDLKSEPDKILYVEKFIQGKHYIAYFIGDEECLVEKLPLTHEHTPAKVVPLTKELKNIILHWKQHYDLLFGHLDLVIEEKTNKVYIVDTGSFPEFSNWQCGSQPVKKVCDLILSKAKLMK